jgi:hypothetical protein
MRCATLPRSGSSSTPALTAMPKKFMVTVSHDWFPKT